MSAARVLILPVVWAMSEGAETLASAQAGWADVSAAMGTCPAPMVGEVAFYRKYTEGMLRRYLRLSMEAGRVPSFLGRPMFRGGRVTSYRIRGFDDVVIFVHDVDRCLRRLTQRQQALIERIALQEHTQGDTAEMLGMSLRSVTRRYAEAIDALSAIFLETGLLEPLLECQGAE